MTNLTVKAMLPTVYHDSVTAADSAKLLITKITFHAEALSLTLTLYWPCVVWACPFPQNIPKIKWKYVWYQQRIDTITSHAWELPSETYIHHFSNTFESELCSNT